MEMYGRQGDLVFKKLNKPMRAEGLKLVKGLVLAGTDSSPHTVVGEVLHRAEGAKHFFRVEKPTESAHAGRHKAMPLETGDYECYPLRERHDGQDRAVED